MAQYPVSSIHGRVGWLFGWLAASVGVGIARSAGRLVSRFTDHWTNEDGESADVTVGNQSSRLTARWFYEMNIGYADAPS